jgi:hypothetical protein
MQKWVCDNGVDGKYEVEDVGRGWFMMSLDSR